MLLDQELSVDDFQKDIGSLSALSGARKALPTKRISEPLTVVPNHGTESVGLSLTRASGGVTCISEYVIAYSNPPLDSKPRPLLMPLEQPSPLIAVVLVTQGGGQDMHRIR